jgi:hypothetical protein
MTSPERVKANLINCLQQKTTTRLLENRLSLAQKLQEKMEWIFWVKKD